MAAAMAMGLAQAPAFAAEPPSVPETLKLEQKPGGPAIGAPKIFFNKVGGQIDCDYVSYELRFGIELKYDGPLPPDAVEALKKLQVRPEGSASFRPEHRWRQCRGRCDKCGRRRRPSVVISTTTTRQRHRVHRRLPALAGGP